MGCRRGLLNKKAILRTRTMRRRRPKFTHHNITDSIIFNSIQRTSMGAGRFRLNTHIVLMSMFSKTTIMIHGNQMRYCFSKISQKCIGGIYITDHMPCDNRQILFQIVTAIRTEIIRKRICPIHSSTFPTVCFHVFQSGTDMLFSCRF